jgi:hypothetical protein
MTPYGLVRIEKHIDDLFKERDKRFREYKVSQERAHSLFEKSYELRHKVLEEKLNPLVTEKEQRQGAMSRSNWFSVIAIALALIDLVLRLLSK